MIHIWMLVGLENGFWGLRFMLCTRNFRFDPWHWVPKVRNMYPTTLGCDAKLMLIRRFFWGDAIEQYRHEFTACKAAFGVFTR